MTPSATRDVARHERHRRRQDDVLGAVADALKQHDQVRGLLLEGSHATDTHDGFSDIDVTCVVSDDTFDVAATVIGAAADSREPLSHFTVDGRLFFLLGDGVRLDVDVRTPAEAAGLRWQAGHAWRILYDPDGVLARASAASPAIASPPAPTWFDPRDPTCFTHLFWLFRAAYAWTRRGAAGGRTSFDKLSRAMEAIAEIRGDLSVMRVWIDGRRCYLEEADADLVTRLSGAFPRLAPAQMLGALDVLHEVAQEILPRFCRAAGFPLPCAELRMLRAIVEELVALPDPA